MITIFVYGLDQFVVGKLSREMSDSIAKLYEVELDEVNFVAPNAMVFHNGVEQTSWNVLVEVHAPLKVTVLQEEVSKYIFACLKDVAINTTIEYKYYSQDHREQSLNNEYPRFIASDNLVDLDTEYDEDMEEGEDEDQIYTGDIFENFNGDKR